MEAQHGNGTTTMSSCVAAPISTSLTPIRIRGKKRQHADPAIHPPSGPRSLHNGVSGSSLGNHRERISTRTAKFKSRQSLSRTETPASVASSSSFSHLLHQHTKPRQRVLSWLEVLPAELLQFIFIENCNTALPLCSPFIAAKLSRRSVYKQFITRVFCQVSCTRSRDVWRVDGGLDGTDEELTMIRNKALRIRWMEWGLFSEATDAVLEKEKKRLNSEVFSNGSDEDDKVFHTHGLRIYLEKGIRVPRKLLTWPCQGDQFHFLRALVNMGATIEDKSLEQEIARETWLRAIRDKDYRLVHLLMEPGMFSKLSLEDLKEAVPAVEGDLAMGSIVYIMAELDFMFAKSSKIILQDFEVVMGKLYLYEREKIRSERMKQLREAKKRKLQKSRSHGVSPSGEQGLNDYLNDDDDDDDDDDMIEEEDRLILNDMREIWREKYLGDVKWQDTLLGLYVPE